MNGDDHPSPSNKRHACKAAKRIGKVPERSDVKAAWTGIGHDMFLIK